MNLLDRFLRSRWWLFGSMVLPALGASAGGIFLALKLAAQQAEIATLRFRVSACEAQRMAEPASTRRLVAEQLASIRMRLRWDERKMHPADAAEMQASYELELTTALAELGLKDVP